ncbi:MAG: S-ribosylhomocysteine lyase [Muribaculaceae bacterium]|nr:S-ribosylhomocysteine lyase [Muribaculaceae bacterium]
MEKIASFRIDHNRLLRGVYVSRRDITPNGDVITTFDVRLTEPNRMKAVSPEALHTIEHLAATFLRNHPDWKDKIVYWGPMGCCTGNYLIMQGDLQPEQILPLLKETFRFISDFEGEIPGATPADCGNYLFNDLKEAKKVAGKFLVEVLEKATEENLRYPGNEQ